MIQSHTVAWDCILLVLTGEKHILLWFYSLVTLFEAQGWPSVGFFSWCACLKAGSLNYTQAAALTVHRTPLRLRWTQLLVGSIYSVCWWFLFSHNSGDLSSPFILNHVVPTRSHYING